MYFGSAYINGAESAIVSEDKKNIYELNAVLRRLSLPTVRNIVDFIEKQDDDIVKKIKSTIQCKCLNPLDSEKLVLLAAIPKPRRNVFCVGKNYADHICEMNTAFGSYSIPEKPMYFTKAAIRSTGPNQTASAYSEISDKADYEAELIIVLGKQTHKVKRENAKNCIFGYACGNDLSLRDIQNERGQVFYGKSFDGLFAMGTWIAHKSIIKSPPTLNICSYVNGELRQNSNTANMIFDPPTIIEDISSGITLEAGDMIMTGSPSGSACNSKDGYLKAGDKLKTSIEAIDEFEIIIN